MLENPVSSLLWFNVPIVGDYWVTTIVLKFQFVY